MNEKTRDLVLLPLLALILFLQEEILAFLPNIKLTVFLILLYGKKLGFVRSSLTVFLYVFLDVVYMNSFSLVFSPFMLLGWMLIPFSMNTLFRHCENTYVLALAAAVHSFLYCWIYLIPNALILHADIFAYLMADVVFEALLAISSFLCTLWLYEPLSRVFARLLPGK